MAGAGDGVGAHQHTSSLQSFSAIGDGAAESQFDVPPAPHRVLRLRPGLDSYKDDKVVVVGQRSHGPCGDAPSTERYIKSRILNTDTITLGTECLSRAPPHLTFMSPQGPENTHAEKSGKMVEIKPKIFSECIQPMG